MNVKNKSLFAVFKAFNLINLLTNSYLFKKKPLQLLEEVCLFIKINLIPYGLATETKLLELLSQIG